MLEISVYHFTKLKFWTVNRCASYLIRTWYFTVLLRVSETLQIFRQPAIRQPSKFPRPFSTVYSVARSNTPNKISLPTPTPNSDSLNYSSTLARKSHTFGPITYCLYAGKRHTLSFTAHQVTYSYLYPSAL